MPRFFKIALRATILIFALVGASFTAVFIAMQFDVLTVRGSIDERNAFFIQNTSTTSTKATTIASEPCADLNNEMCAWNQTPEWLVIREGLRKDKDIIHRVAKETGIPARVIAAVVIPEQTRFFTSNREVFKRYFEPLKILGSLSQFSLGVSGIKEETAELIEKHAHDTASSFYPGSEASPLIAYAPNVNKNEELFNRLTDAKNHYYSYLYTALFIKEIEAQWGNAGFMINNNAGVLATLFNLGFNKSIPNNSPETGGAPISTGGKVYSYGKLAEYFYTSDELITVFPRESK